MNDRKRIKHKPGSFFLRRKRLIRRVFLIALAAAALVVLGWFAYVMLHFQFYTGYRDVLEPRAYETERGAPFAALADEQANVPGMVLAAENEHFKLDTNTKTAEIAVYDKRKRCNRVLQPARSGR